MMLRRTLIVTTGLATLPSLLQQADSQELPPDLSTADLLDSKMLVAQALSLAREVGDNAEEQLYEYVQNGLAKAGLSNELPANLLKVSPNILASLAVAEHNLSRFLFAVLRASKSPSNGQIYVTKEKVQQVHQTCSFWPFCYLWKTPE